MKRTTFVIGAGVSKQLGFPLGWEMVEQAIHDFHAMARSRSNPYTQHLVRLHGTEATEEIARIVNALKFGDYPSLDKYAQTNKIHADMIKYFIAKSLLLSERNNIDKVNVRDKRVVQDEEQDNVYRTIWQCMMREENILKEIHNHNYITFNYERTIEHFFYNKILLGLNNSPADANRTFRAINIAHVYGTLGRYEPDLVTRDQPQPDFLESVLTSSETLSLVPKLGLRVSSMEYLIDCFENTHQVVVLGFGFDKTNCSILMEAYKQAKRLDSNDALREAVSDNWYASTYRLPPYNQIVAEEYMGIRQERMSPPTAPASTAVSMAFDYII